MILGGVATNALPEQAWAVVNQRVSTTSDIQAAQERDIDLLKTLALRFNLIFEAFGHHISGESPSSGTLNLTVLGDTIEPAPKTPTDSEAAPYQLLSGTIKAAYKSYTGGDDIFVSPGIMSGNTDTLHYWNLTDSIFRYNHNDNGNSTDALGNGVHTVNEHMNVTSYLGMIGFYVTLILNADETNTF